jgi:beta-glucosidase-like glycosyl hydrolase
LREQAIVRGEWGFEGFFISDCDALRHFCNHNYSLGRANGTNVHAALVQGGVDYNCGQFYQEQMYKQLQAGAIGHADVDRAVRRVLRTMMRLGMVDAQEGQIYPTLGAEVVDRKEAREQSLRAATEGIVLLKNDGAMLPLSSSSTTTTSETHGHSATMRGLKLAFVGPLANATQDMLSAPQYHGQNTLVDTHSPLQVAVRRGWSVVHERGCAVCDTQPKGYPNMPCEVQKKDADTSGFAAAVKAAEAADVAVLFLGNDPRL